MDEYKIDLVYMWVDGKDPQWLKKKALYDKSLDVSNLESFSECRYYDNDELKYSLRSVEKYVPWINHIYIITDRQKPSWLNEDNPKVTIIDHEGILPKEILPCFNSTALEWGLANISKLSEHFIYQNDDTMFADYLMPKDFFDKSGRPIVRLRKRNLLYYRYKKHSNYAQIVFRSIKMIKEDFGQLYPSTPHHCADAYLKSTYLDCVSKYKSRVDETITHRFREDNNIHRSLVTLYSLATNKAVLRWVPTYNKFKSGLCRLLHMSSKRCDSVHISINEKDYLKILNNARPMMLCLNDNQRSKQEDRERVHAFLNEYYPEKSSFEK